MHRHDALSVSCLLVWLVFVPNHQAEALTDIKVSNDRAPDCSSLGAIVRTVTRDCATDDERVIALYNFCRYACYHHAYPSEPGGISALKLINVYGWGLCGGEHTVMAALWEAAGYRWRYRGWSSPGHTTVEVFYGGRWHYLDTFLKFYAWMPAPGTPSGRTIASQEDIRANPSLLTDGFWLDPARKVCYQRDNRFDYVGKEVNWTAPAFLVCGDTLSGVLSGTRSSHRAGSPRAWGGIRFDDPSYSTRIDLAAGHSLTLGWGKTEGAFYFRGRKQPPRHTCGDKDYRNCPAIGPLLEPYHALGAARSWSNGVLRFRADFHDGSILESFSRVENVVCRRGALHPDRSGKPGRVVIDMASPYVVAGASGKIVSDGAKIDVSADGKSWTPTSLDDLGGTVRGRYAYSVRVTFDAPVTYLELISTVQHNQEALPYLAPGQNEITVSVGNPEELKSHPLLITYAYCPGSREWTPAQLLEADAEIARAHHATWSDRPIVVQKRIESSPATIEIPVPTPKNRRPVYPRMLFLRREVLLPGQKPLDVPVPATVPEVGEGRELAALPEPWLIGTRKPPVAPKRPTKRETRSPERVAYVSKKGEVFDHQFVKWLKDDSNAWILLADFDVGDLPDLESLACAKLVLHVHEAHDRAPMRVAVVGLEAPFVAGKPYDFSRLGKTIGTAIVERGGGSSAPFHPPRRYEIDVTRAARAWSRGEAFHGVAVRIVPDRGVDDGWTVRFTPAEEKPLELVIEKFVE